MPSASFVLVDEALRLAKDRVEGRVAAARLRAEAGGDASSLREAWTTCVDAVAEGEDLVWLRAATYLMSAMLTGRRGSVPPI